MTFNRQPAMPDVNAKFPVGDTIAERVMSRLVHPYLNETAIQQITTQISAKVQTK